MRELYLFFNLLFSILFFYPVFSQINSGNPAIPFGLNSGYRYGIMPTNLPTSGTYAESQAAASAYIYWKNNLTETCTKGVRVKYDKTSQTVSEGIAYGMLLAAYAGDKDLFDGLWEYYKAHVNLHGVMHWKINGCLGILAYNGATDADLDAAMALIIASKQWPSFNEPYVYREEAFDLIEAIRLYEIDNSTFQTLNGDTWGTYNTCRNPSYFAIPYYRQFAKFDTTYAKFWSNVAHISEDFLLINRDDSTGLICNWADNNGISNDCNNTSQLDISNEYGFDACRNPWRMATDVLWYGTDTADVANDICKKVATWLRGYESNLKGPLAQNAVNPGQGKYKNGAFSTYALTTMVDSIYQESLNSCYASISTYSNEVYFNQTIKTITLFMLTGNFWNPDIVTETIPPKFINSTTNTNGTVITVNLGKTLTTPVASDCNAFTLSINGTVVADAFNGIVFNGTKTVNLILSPSVSISKGNVLTLAYTPGSIESTEGVPMEAFSGRMVTNAIGTATIVADCDEGGKTKLFTKWYTFNDNVIGGSSTVIPLTDDNTIFKMTAGGVNASDSAAKIEYSLYGEDVLGTNPFVGLGFSLYSDEAAYDLSGSKGISFYHKGDAVDLEVVLATNTDSNYYCAPVSAHEDWTLVTLLWEKFKQKSGSIVDWDVSQVTKLQWRRQANDNSTGEVWIDEVQIDGIILDLPSYEGEVIKTVLYKKISEASSVANNARVGISFGNYPQSAIDALRAVITLAQEVYDNSDATQAEVNNAINTLDDAIDIFIASKITTTGITEQSILPYIYPNPVNNQLTIEVDGLQKVVVTTVAGQIFIESTESIIDVSGLTKGIYMLTVVSSNGTTSTMFVK